MCYSSGLRRAHGSGLAPRSITVWNNRYDSLSPVSANRYGRVLFDLALIALLPVAPAGAQVRLPSAAPPRLVVVLAVDQMRPDYVERFGRWFGPGGFRRFLDKGATFTEARYHHADTSTCPGHAVMATGSHGDMNGIVANDWYDARRARVEYCAADSSARPVGTSAPLAGRSPRNLLMPTVGDLLKGSTAGRSRVITVAPKDRSAIMLGGRRADAAYWMEDSLFVTSTWYRRDLPRWVRNFNGSGLVSAHSGKVWDRLLPAEAYAAMGPDDAVVEEDAYGMGRTFPHVLGGEDFIAAFNRTPFSNDLVADFAMRAIEEEMLGRDDIPDLIGIGFSASDRGGHAFGPDSHEVMDLTIRLDRTLERLFSFLDRVVGPGRVLVVLTADHGIATIPEILAARDPATGARRVSPAAIHRPVEGALAARYGAANGRWIVYDSGRFLYLNLPELRARGIAVADAERTARDALAQVPGVHAAVTATELRRQRAAGTKSAAVRSFHPDRSGNLYYELAENLLADSEPTGTNHGSPWSYDAGVPLLWFGAAIRPGVHGGASVADIAPTLLAILGIEAPASVQGRVLREMLRPRGRR